MNGKSVTSIGESAFEDKGNLTSIIIPEGVTSIGYSAFAYSYNLTSIAIPNTVTSIGGSAFASCTSLTSIVIPEGVTRIGIQTFDNCTSLTAITIPNSVTSIDLAAFYNCTSLTSVVIPGSVTNIGDNAFTLCTGLTSLTIQNGVTSIGYVAFYNCVNLTSITLPESLTSIGNNAFDNINNYAKFYVPNQRLSDLLQSYKIGNIQIIVGSQNQTYKVTYDGNESTGTVPTDSESYAGDAVATVLGNTGSLVKDGYTFAGWNTAADGSGTDYAAGSSLAISDSNVTLYAKWTKNQDQDMDSEFTYQLINNDTEYEITGYTGTNTDVTIPSKINGKNVTSIGNRAFYYCSVLKSITIPEGVTSIGNFAFNYCTSLTSITIPNSVTSIGDYAFYVCVSLTSIAIPNNVTSIGDSAFMYCSSLMSITIPDSVTSINNSAFDYINDHSILYVDSERLEGLLQPYKVGNIKIIVGNQTYTVTYDGNGSEGGSVPTDSGSYAANATATVLDNTSLVKDGYTFAGWNTAADGSGTDYPAGSSLAISDSNVTLYARWTKNQDIDPDFTYQLINNDTEYEITGYTGTNKDITIPSQINGKNVTVISDYAFNERRDVTSIIIPDSVTSIGDYAFYYCTNLKSIKIPDSVKSIGTQVFRDCINLTSIIIPDSVTSIGYAAFYNCRGLTSLIVPSNVTNIEGYAFGNCVNLTSITIPDSVTSIGGNAFYNINYDAILYVDSQRLADLLQPYKVGNIQIIVGNQNQTYAVTYNGNGNGGGTAPTDLGSYQANADVTVLGNTDLVKDGYTFAGWNTAADGSGTDYPAGSSLTIGSGNVTLYAKWTKNQDIDPGLTYQLINNDTEYSITGYTGTSTDITIPSQINGKNVTAIGDDAFNSHENLKSIIIPDSVTSIGGYAFINCVSLKSITIPDSITSIGFAAFYNCASLTSLTIPNSVTNIEAYTFGDCSNLTLITIPDSVTTIGHNAFYAINNNAIFYVDSQRLANLLQPYKIGNIKIIVGNQNETYTVTYDGNGSTGGTVPTDSGSYAGDATATVLENTGNLVKDGYTFVGWNTEADGSGIDYSDGSSLAISDSNVTLYAKWTKNQDIDPGFTYQLINNGTEYEITGYTGTSTDITIPSKINGKNVTSIGNRAFQEKSNVTSIVIPEGVTNIGYAAFANCSGLTAITIPNSVTSIGDIAFYTCSNLRSIVIPEGVTSIGQYTFGECSGLTSVTIPNSVTSIGDSAFSRCSNLTSITIPENVTSVGNYAFTGCIALTSITMPNSVTSIGYVAFNGCSNLTSIIIPDSVTSIGEYSFNNINNNAIFYVDSQRLANLLQVYKMGNIKIIVGNQNETYIVTYAGNGNTEGTVPTDSGNYETNVAATVLDNTGSLKRTGYTFAGWNTAADGKG
ncbi:leucine-rich repeat protein, partial [Clostridium beijerinckii]|uniref:leucine-rich repeat protein n=1 Tax=Clostridium beijerinckii TaxID=1520 RepID=UPI0024184478